MGPGVVENHLIVYQSKDVDQIKQNKNRDQSQYLSFEVFALRLILE